MYCSQGLRRQVARPAGLGQRRVCRSDGEGFGCFWSPAAPASSARTWSRPSTRPAAPISSSTICSATDDKWRNLAQAPACRRGPAERPVPLARWPQARRRDPPRRHLGHHGDRRRSRARQQFPAVARACSTGARRRARRSSMRPRPRPMATARAAFRDDWSPAALKRFTPMNLYGWSKHLFDLAVVERATKKDKLPPQWAGLKFFNVFGPNEYHKGAMASVLCRAFDEAKAGGAVRLFKSHRPGHRGRRPAARFHLCRRRGRGGALADGDAVGIAASSTSAPARRAAFRDMITALFRALGREPNIEYVDMPEAIRAPVPVFHAGRGR